MQTCVEKTEECRLRNISRFLHQILRINDSYKQRIADSEEILRLYHESQTAGISSLVLEFGLF